MSHRMLFLLGIALVLLGAALLAMTPSAPDAVLAQDGGGEDGEEGCPDGVCPDWIVEAWAGSAHADADSEAFVHWDEDDPAVVPERCAKCHSEGGYLDHLGVDDSEFGVVDAPAEIGTVVSCTVCHNPVAPTLETVMFPSGAEVGGLDASTRCAECHQGRASTVQVNNAIEEAGLGLDESSEELGFVNIHYFAAAASLYGSDVQGGYEYEGHAYQGRFYHVEDYNTCAGCHSPHTLEVKIEECAACHTGVATLEDVEAIRMAGSLVDYDGDGDMEESLRSEMEGVQEQLYAAIQAYASDVVGTPIVYDSAAYPYFFIDSDGSGEVDGEEASYGNRYNAFTPRLLQAVYNFQTYEKDPGAFAHNAKYHIQLMYDSIMSLNEALGDPMGMMLQRDDVGHFDSTSEAWRHWDEDDPAEVPASCSKCHTAEGLPFFIEHETTISFEPSDSMACTTCHASNVDFTLYEVNEVPFPNGAMLTFGEGVTSNLCLECHQGRESTVSVNAAIESAGVGDDESSEALRFRNIHYFAAGATLFGHEAQGVYEYEGKEYVGRFIHVPGFDTCASCHTAHELDVQVQACTQCHGEFEDPADIRFSMTGAMIDYDGDGDTTEGVAYEIQTMEEALYAELQAYAADTVGMPIGYESHSYPYFFNDSNGDGMIDDEEAAYPNAYASWTPTLLRAAYNYQYVAKDPGAYAHNADYVIQVLYDSLEAIGGPDAVEGMTRP